MKKCMKSLLGITLAIATLLSVVPIGVFAAVQQPTAIRSSIVAVKDVTLTVPFTSTGEANTTAKVAENVRRNIVASLWIIKKRNAFCF